LHTAGIVPTEISIGQEKISHELFRRFQKNPAIMKWYIKYVILKNEDIDPDYMDDDEMVDFTIEDDMLVVIGGFIESLIARRKYDGPGANFLPGSISRLVVAISLSVSVLGPFFKVNQKPNRIFYRTHQ